MDGHYSINSKETRSNGSRTWYASFQLLDIGEQKSHHNCTLLTYKGEVSRLAEPRLSLSWQYIASLCKWKRENWTSEPQFPGLSYIISAPIPRNQIMRGSRSAYAIKDIFVSKLKIWFSQITELSVHSQITHAIYGEDGLKRALLSDPLSFIHFWNFLQIAWRERGKWVWSSQFWVCAICEWTLIRWWRCWNNRAVENNMIWLSWAPA